jgi:hypothetical protein
MQAALISDDDFGLLCQCCDLDKVRPFWSEFYASLGFIPYVPGIPSGSVELTSHEKNEILLRWAGNWSIVPIPTNSIKDARNAPFFVAYESAHINNDTITLSGGTHGETMKSTTKADDDWFGFDTWTTKTKNVPVRNEPKESKILLYRGPNGTLYIDNIGSYILAEEPQARIEIQWAMGWKTILFRDAVLDVGGRTVRNQKMDRGDEDVPSKMVSLKELRDSGVITESEFSQKKRELLERM